MGVNAFSMYFKRCAVKIQYLLFLNLFVQQEHQEFTTIFRYVFAAFGCIRMHCSTVF